MVLSEILAADAGLIVDAGISDYVLSNSMVSDAIAMVAEDRDVNRILNSLFEERREFISGRRATTSRRARPSGRRRVRGATSRHAVASGGRATTAVVNPPDKSTVRSHY